VKATIRGLLSIEMVSRLTAHYVSQTEGVVLLPGVREACERTSPPWVPRSGRRRLEPVQSVLAIRRRARLTASASALAAHAGSLGQPCF
jgi:hypothetical protein